MTRSGACQSNVGSSCFFCGVHQALDSLDCHYHLDIRRENDYWDAIHHHIAAIVHEVETFRPYEEDRQLVEQLLHEELGEIVPVSLRPKAPKRRRFTASHKVVHALIERDGDRCAYCSIVVSCACDPGDNPGVADHVMPRSRGGLDGIENRLLSCWRCNTSKGDRTPSEWGVLPWGWRDE